MKANCGGVSAWLFFFFCLFGVFIFAISFSRRWENMVVRI